jgi:Rrf2 family transcriptional regulator, cysteine metabolism repressor
MRTSIFSAKAEYACIAMLELAAQYGDSQPVRLKTISDAHEIPDRFLVQILLQLKGAGLIVSARGAAGGYLLARSPDQISMADIVGVIDRHERSGDGDRKKPAAKIDNMPQTNAVLAIRALWRDVEMAQRQILEQTTLAELVRRSQESFALSYNI